MNDVCSLVHLGAARLTASTFGVLSGLGGIRHGVGEIRQGNVKAEGIFIDSWTTGPLATSMDGEPGMTIIPNLLATGILAIIVSLAVIVWSIAFVQRKHGGLVLLLLSIVMLLVGGGVGPPVIGMLAGLAGMAINSPHPWWRTHVPLSIRHIFARLWPWVFGVAVVNGLFLFIGSLILVYWFDFDNADAVLMSFLLAVVFMLLCGVTGVAYDMQGQDQGDLASG